MKESLFHAFHDYDEHLITAELHIVDHRHMPKVAIEVCCDSLFSAQVAQRCKADRIELCSSIDEGGITPSLGLVQTTLRHFYSSTLQQNETPLPRIHVLIRPRPGDFIYKSHELEVIRQDTLNFISHGCNGIVFGFLNPDATIDESLTRHFRDLCYSLDVDTTFHRAFDVVKDQFSALDTLIDCKIPRVLTSGGHETAFQGAERIAQLVAHSEEGTIRIMPGGGITLTNAETIVECTGAQEIHGTFRRAIPSSMQYKHGTTTLSRDDANDAVFDYTSRSFMAEVSRNLCVTDEIMLRSLVNVFSDVDISSV